MGGITTPMYHLYRSQHTSPTTLFVNIVKERTTMQQKKIYLVDDLNFFLSKNIFKIKNNHPTNETFQNIEKNDLIKLEYNRQGIEKKRANR